MEGKKKSTRTAVCVLALIYGAFNLLSGILGLLGGSLSILGGYVWVSLALFGAGLIFGGLVVLRGKMRERWRLIAVIILLLSLTAFVASVFYRGIAWSHMINVVVSFVFLNYAK